jgi:hypothetical protein
MYLLKPMRQMNNVSNEKMLTLRELNAVSKRQMQLLQLPNNRPRVSLWAMLYLVLVVNPEATSPRTLTEDHIPRPQLLPSSGQDEPRRHCLRARDLLRDFEQDGHEVCNSPQANLGTALAELGQLGDTPANRCLQAHIRITIAHV